MLSLPQEGQKVLGLNLNRSESNARAIGPNDSILQAAASLLHCAISAHSMSALGQERTKRHHGAMSALPPKADKLHSSPDVRFVPKADSCGAANDVYAGQQRWQHGEAVAPWTTT
jgi:hypothetical protein